MDDFIPVSQTLQIPSNVQDEREAGRLALLQEEQATYPNDANITKEIKNNRPIKSKFAPVALKQEEDEDFISVQPEASDDFIPANKSKVAQATGSAMAGVDFLAPIGAAVGGVSGLGKLAMGGSVDEAVSQIHKFDDWSPSGLLQKLGVPKEYVTNESAQHVLDKLGIPGDKLGDIVMESTKSPTAAAAAKVITDMALMILGVKGAGKLTEGTVRPSFEKPAPLPEPGPSPVLTRQTDLPLEQPEGLQSQLPVDYHSSKLPMDPEGLFGDHPARPEEPLSKQGELGLSMEPDPKALADDLANNIGPDLFSDANRASMQELAKKSEIDLAWEDFKAKKEEIGPQTKEVADELTSKREKYGHEDSFEPEQGSRIVEKITRPISNRSPMAKQRGAVDISDLDGIAKTVESVLPMAVLRRLRGLFKEQELPNAASLDFLREKMKDGKLPNEQDKPIVVITDKGAAIYDGNHRVKVAGELGWKDMPVVVKDYTTSNRYDGRSKAVQEADRATRGPNFGKFKQGGAIDFKAMFGKKDQGGPTRGDMIYSKDNLKDMVYFALRQSTNRHEFTDRLKYLSDDPTFQETVVARAQAMWDDRQGIMEKYDGSVFSKMGEASKKESVDFRPIDLMLEEEGITSLSPKDDIGQANRFLNIPQIMAQITKGNGGKIYKNVFSLGMDISNQATKHFKDMIEHGKAYANLKRGEQMRVRKVQIAFDGIMNDKLRDAGLQWPTHEMLQGEGLKPKEIEAYLEETKGLDKMYDIIEQSLIDFGQIPPERIPGWFPHYWSGSYRVQLSDVHGLVTVRAFATRPQAQFFARQALKDGLTSRIEEPQAKLRESDIVSNMVQAMQAFRKKSALNDALSAKIQKYDEFATRGIIREALEREGVDGFDAAQGFKPDIPFTPWRAHNDRILSAYQQSMEAASRFWRNTRVVKDIRTPLFAEVREGLFDKTPNLKQAIDEYIGRTTGNTRNHLKVVDEYLRGIAIKMGLPPNLAQSGVSAMNQFMILSKLRLPNPAFIAANIVQPIMNAHDLIQIHSERTIAGEKTVNPIPIFIKLLTEQAKGLTFQKQGTGEFADALRWAKENNKIDVFQVDHLDPIKQTDPIFKVEDRLVDKLPRGIEKSGRTATFLASYAYLKEVMPPREALEAAAQRIDLTMGNYNQQFTPSMYADHGVAGKTLRPFALLRNVYLGKAAMAFQTMIDGMKNGKPISGLAPLVSMVALYTTFAGLTGNLGFEEWDAFARAYNTVNPDDPMRRPYEILKEKGVPTVWIYGVFGQTLPGQPNIGPSLAAPSVTEVGIPVVGVGMSAWQLFKEAYNYTTPEGANQENVMAALKRLAPPLVVSNLMDPHYAEKQGGITPRASKFDKGHRRTDEEDMTARVWGKQAISEADEKAQLNNAEYIKRTDTQWKQEQISKTVDSMLGIGPDNFSALIENMEKSGRGMDADKIITALKAEMQRRLVDQKAQMYSQLIKSTDPAQKARTIQIMQKLGLL